MVLLAAPDRRQPVVSLNLVVLAGSMGEGPLLGSGLSHYLEHALFLGSRHHRGLESWSRSAENLGACDQNAHTSSDHTAFYFTADSGRLDEALHLLADLVLRPTFPADRLKREKKVILAELTMDRDEVESRMGQDFINRVYPDHPCRLPILGEEEKFRALTVNDVAAYHQRRYIAPHFTLAISGDFDCRKALDLAARHFADAPGGHGRDPLEPSDTRHGLRPFRTVQALAVEQPRLRLSWPIPPWNHPHAPSWDLMETLLGWGRDSLLSRKFVENGKVSGLEVSSWTPGFRGMFDVGFLLHDKPQLGPDLVKEISDTLQDPKTFRRDDLDAALGKAAAEVLSTLETTPGLAQSLAFHEALTDGFDHEVRRLESMAATTPDSIRDLRGELSPDKLMAALYVPRKDHKSWSGIWKGLGPSAPLSGSSRRKTSVSRPQIKRTQLTGGTVLLHHQGGVEGMAHVAFIFAGGQRHETPKSAGLFHVLSRLWSEGAKGLPAHRLSRLVEGRGGALSTHSGSDHIGLSASWLPGEGKSVLNAIRAILTEPTLPEAARRVEIDRCRESWQMEQETVGDMARRLMRRHLWGQHGYGLSPRGDLESLPYLRLPMLREAHRRHICQGNLVVCTAGDVPLDHLNKVIERLPTGCPPDPGSPVLEALDGATLKHPMPGKEQTVVQWVLPAPDLFHPDHRLLELLSMYLGSLGGPLFALRGEGGAAYQVGFTRLARIGTAVHTFQMTLGKGRGGEWASVVKDFKEVVERLCKKPLPPTDITRLLSLMRGVRGLSGQAWLDRCQNLAWYERLGPGHEAYDRETRFEEKPSDLGRSLFQVTRRHLNPQKGSILLTGSLS